MAKIFKFQDKKGLELNIAGAEFNVDVKQPGFIKALKSFGKDLIKFGEEHKANYSKLENVDDIDKFNVEELLEYNNRLLVDISNGLDLLLREGATKDIFGSREIHLDDLVDVSLFVIGEINEHVEKEKVSKYSPSRALK